MPTFQRQIITPPERLPVSLDEFKAHARIDDDTPEEDALIAGYIAAATEITQNHCSMVWMTQTWEFTFHEWPRRGPLVIPYGPVRSIASVGYHDRNDVLVPMATPADYRVRGIGGPRTEIYAGDAMGWPGMYWGGLGPGGIKVRAVLGWDELRDREEPVKLAILQFATKLYDFRGDNTGAQDNPLPTSVQFLLAGHTRPRV